jgi:hypothetical protein
VCLSVFITMYVRLCTVEALLCWNHHTRYHAEIHLRYLRTANIHPDAIVAYVLYNLRDMQSYFKPVKEQTHTKHLPDTQLSSCVRYRLQGRLHQISV